MLNSLKPHIGIFGRINVGKSSFINAISKQEVAIVSEAPGTTTDPVKKTMEMPDVGPVVVIDTAGIDDVGDLGNKRVAASKKVINQINLGIIIITNNQFGDYEKDLIETFKRFKTACLIVHNKSDLAAINEQIRAQIEQEYGLDVLDFCALGKDKLDTVVATIRKNIPAAIFDTPSVFGDLVEPGDVVLMVTPVDAEAPQGRMILPQSQAIRDALDNDCIAVVLKETELNHFLKNFDVTPKLVITDSQAFAEVAEAVPTGVALTSFSILFSRLKGDFELFTEGTKSIGKLKDDQNVLIMESCSHHAVGDDIGRVKLPKWISDYTGKKLNFDVVAGNSNPPKDLTEYSLIIQCGGCMMTRKQIINRANMAKNFSVPITNYGMAISYCLGVFERAMSPFFIEKSRNN